MPLSSPTHYNNDNLISVSDGSWNYTWEHGRELASMSKNSALIITRQPEDCFCTLGGEASFTVIASGTGLSCRWQYSADGGKTWTTPATPPPPTPPSRSARSRST